MHYFRSLHDPDPAQIGDSPEAFLRFLGQPACIELTGKNPHRTRAYVTLLHGNEPSGMTALWRWLRSGERPAVNVLCLIPAVEAAMAEPAFSHRFLPGCRDLNRCFRAPYDDEQGRLAQEILTILREARPEAVIDVHNTSGSNPAFGVAVHEDRMHDALVSLYAHQMVVTDLRLGALMEITETITPTVTVECGGRMESIAHEVAWQGLYNYFTAAEVLRPSPDLDMQHLHNPVRLELSPDSDLTYANGPQAIFDLTLKADIEQFNYCEVCTTTALGWVGEKQYETFQPLRHDDWKLADLISIRDGVLYPARSLRLFMITTNPEIARTDCLFYAVPA